MARKLRVEFEGAIYHATVRANGREKLFEDDTDRRYLLDRFGEGAQTYQVRIYLFCLMSNHFHLVVETPRGNLGRFMQSVLTGYGVYYNRRHRTHGHVTQGRYGARLVEGNEYLLKLSRYVHLNPVKMARMKSAPVSERLEALRKYSWSSFQAYAGLASRNDFIDYKPVLALLEGGKGRLEDRYREFVEAGVAQDDKEFVQALWLSSHCIGGEDFREDVEERYKELLQGRRVPEDVALRHIVKTLPAERIIEVVSSVAGLDPKNLVKRQRDSRWRAVTARMLCRYGGLTQREVATILGVRTGVAVSCQLRKLADLLRSEETFGDAVHKIEKRLSKELGR